MKHQQEVIVSDYLNNMDRQWMCRHCVLLLSLNASHQTWRRSSCSLCSAAGNTHVELSGPSLITGRLQDVTLVLVSQQKTDESGSRSVKATRLSKKQIKYNPPHDWFHIFWSPQSIKLRPSWLHYVSSSWPTLICRCGISWFPVAEAGESDGISWCFIKCDGGTVASSPSAVCLTGCRWKHDRGSW